MPLPLRSAAALVILAFAPELAGADDSTAIGSRVAAGALLAREACAACHQVSPDQPTPPPVYDPDQQAGIPAPSFLAIARERKKDEAYLLARITHPHYPMKEQVIDGSDVDAIVAYIGSLRDRTERR